MVASGDLAMTRANKVKKVKKGMKKISIIFLIIFVCCINGFSYELPLVHWFNVYIEDVKIGYCYDGLEKSDYENQGCLKETIFMDINLKRFEANIHLKADSTCYLKEDLTPLFFKYIETMGNQNGLLKNATIPKHFMDTRESHREIEGKLKNKKLYIKSKLAGLTNEYEIPFEKDVILDDNVDEYLRTKGYKVGDRFKVKTFSKDTMKVESININVKELRKEDGLPKDATIPKYYNYTMESHGKEFFIVETELKGIISTHYIDKKGYTLKSEFAQLGITMVKTNKEDALKEYSGSVDIISEYAIKSNRSVDDPRNVVGLNVSIFFKSGIPKNLSGENIERTCINIIKDKTAICSIKKEKFDDSQAISIPILDKNYEKYLKETLYEQSSDKGIIETAKKIVGEEKNSFKAAKKIINWVYDFVKNKNFSVGFNSARETLELKEGDCTEHSVLASALCKAVGVPTKVCGGLVLMKDKFYYHMWIEVYVGKWIGMDPTFNEDIVDAAHIKLSEGILDEEGRFNLLVDILSYFKNIEITVFNLKQEEVWQKNMK
ncbi:MAG: transglutaminase-like domain-containing protein [Candidatus Firestonebacteria bacterium]